MTDPILTVAVTKRLREITVSVDRQFGAGVTAIVGPSGAGKSTLLRLIAGLARPDTGSIVLGGRTLDDVAHGYQTPPARRNISLVFQEYALFPHLSVARNIAYGLEARRVPRAERARRVEAMLEQLGIDMLADARPDRLSGGQRQRVALARALVLEPAALLLDEPLAALDVQTRAAVRHQLREALTGLAIPTLLVTHDYADALVFRDRIVIMDHGQVIQDGTHAELLTHPRSRFVADFTGVNFLEGYLEHAGAGHPDRVRVAGDLLVSVAADGLEPGPVGLTIWPWEIVLSQTPPAGSARNVLAGRVREVLPLGGRARVVLLVGPTHTLELVAEITTESHAAIGCHEGQLMYASFKATAVNLTAV